MPYTPTEWHDGDVITAEKLNKIEQALYELSGGGGDEGNIIIAPEQDVVITDGPATFSFADGYELPETVSEYGLPYNWIVYFNGHALYYNGGGTYYYRTEELSSIQYSLYYDSENSVASIDVTDDEFNTVAGTYRLEIVQPTVFNQVVAVEQSVRTDNGGYATISVKSGIVVTENISPLWVITVNDILIPYSVEYGDFEYTSLDNIFYQVHTISGEREDYIVELYVYDEGNDRPATGTYIVKILGPKIDVPEE